MEINDPTIVERSLSRPAEFAELFDRHFEAIHGYFARRTQRSDADDLAGEVFRIAFEKRTTFDSTRGEFRGWLYGIALNVLRRHRRDAIRQRNALNRIQAEPQTPFVNDVEDRIVLSGSNQTIERLNKLPAVEREALVLYGVDALSYAEIAIATNTPIGTVRSRISRARTALRNDVYTPPATHLIGVPQ